MKSSQHSSRGRVKERGAAFSLNQLLDELCLFRAWGNHNHCAERLVWLVI
jgi:hypothetical protein